MAGTMIYVYIYIYEVQARAAGRPTSSRCSNIKWVHTSKYVVRTMKRERPMARTTTSNLLITIRWNNSIENTSFFVVVLHCSRADARSRCKIWVHFFGGPPSTHVVRTMKRERPMALTTTSNLLITIRWNSSIENTSFLVVVLHVLARWRALAL